TLSFTHDAQTSIRSFVGDVSGDVITSAGVRLEPKENTLFDDARVVSQFRAAGQHEAVGGAAVTWGHTQASGIGFDFDQSLSNSAPPPSSGQIPVGDHRSFDDKRTLLGLYLHDDWTPIERFTLGGGGRYDNVSEDLAAQGQEVGGPLVATTDSRHEGE